jgi:hypothetical protein
MIVERRSSRGAGLLTAARSVRTHTRLVLVRRSEERSSPNGAGLEQLNGLIWVGGRRYIEARFLCAGASIVLTIDWYRGLRLVTAEG